MAGLGIPITVQRIEMGWPSITWSLSGVGLPMDGGTVRGHKDYDEW